MRDTWIGSTALLRWDDFRYLHNFGARDLTWFAIGAVLAVAAIWLLSRQKRGL